MKGDDLRSGLRKPEECKVTENQTGVLVFLGAGVTSGPQQLCKGKFKTQWQAPSYVGPPFITPPAACTADSLYGDWLSLSLLCKTHTHTQSY